MGRFILGFVSAILVLALGLGVIWGLDRFGIIRANTLILKTVSQYPGLKDLAASYELGKKQSAVLDTKVADLRKQQQKLKMEKDKFSQEQVAFDEEKLAWEKAHTDAAHPDTAVPVATTTTGTTQTASKQPLNQLTKEEESKLKQYMGTLGAMKPDKAALVIQKLPENITYLIFEQTSDRQVSKIMENLPPDYLAKLTQDRMNKYK